MRWFLVHWLVYHSLAILLLLMTSFLIFVTQPDIFKLIGLAPLALALVTILLTVKVYNMFVEMSLHLDQSPPGPYLVSEDMRRFRSGSEFYPVDPVSREVSWRLEPHLYRTKDSDQSNLSIVSKQFQDG